MTVARVLLAELDRVELGRRAAAGAVVVLPVGATEQHGPHLPAGVDSLNVEHIARAAGELVAGRTEPGRSPVVVVAPTLPFGASEHHLPFGATLSLDVDVLILAMRSLGRSVAASGFRRLFLLNGHGGNDDAMRLAARAIARETGIVVGAASWFDLAREELLVVGADHLARVPGHAGAFETSAVLALRPDLVADRSPRSAPPGAGVGGGYSPLRIEDPAFWRSIDGFTDDPASADAELGRRCLDAATEVVARTLTDFAARPPFDDQSPHEAEGNE